jgi:hypothetical protein
MPELDLTDPRWRQIADHYKVLILSGEMPAGAPFPSVRDIMQDWNASQSVAQRASEHLRTEGFIKGERGRAALVDASRVKPGPNDWILGTAFPPSNRIEIRAAELIPAPEYVIPLLGLAADYDGVTRVIRREWVIYDLQNVPFTLCVSWLPPRAADPVPELLTLLPLPSLSAAVVIADRTDRPGSAKLKDLWFRTRQIIDDGREGPLLRLPRNARVQAVTYTSTIDKDVQEYGEFVLLEDQTIHTRVGL